MADTQGWAKAWPTDDPAAEAALRAATAADRRRYTVEGMTPVACERCAARVRVRKLTADHTSIQWQDDPVEACPRFAEWAETGKPGALHDSCPDLGSSIAKAVHEGVVPIPEGDAAAVDGPPDTED